MICKTFGKLPNDPLVAKLTPIQEAWVIHNLSREAEEVDATIRKASGKSDTMTLSDSSGVNSLMQAVGRRDGN